MAEEKSQVADPIAAMLAVDDEHRRNEPLPDAELNTDAPADKAIERDESGKFKGKEGKDDKPAEKDQKGESKDAKDAKPDDKKQAEAEKPKDTVPLATFLEKTNKLREQLEQSEISRKQYEQRLAALEAKAAPKPEVPAEPDFVEDPKGYVDAKLEKALKGIEEANKKAETSGQEAKETAAQANEQVQLQRFFTDLQAHEARFVQSNPDYHDALNHVRQVRAAQLREFDPEITDAAIIQTIRGEETNLAVQLARQGRDPVQTAYNLARHYGYQKKAAEPKPNGTDGAGKLPEVKDRRLPPDQTLGTGSSANEDTDPYKPGETDPVDTALASLFKKRA